MHSFANFGLRGGLCDLQMCAMCVGFPNCPEGQKWVGKNKIISVSQFTSCISIFLSQWFNLLVQFLFSALQVTCAGMARAALSHLNFL